METEFNRSVHAPEAGAEDVPLIDYYPDPDPDDYYEEQERKHYAALDALDAEREEKEWFEAHDETTFE